MDKKRLERLFAIHQKLRTMQAYTAQALIEAIAEKVEQYISDRTLRDDIQDLRDMGAEIPKRAKSYRYIVPFSFLEKLDDSYYGSLNEAVALLRQVSKTKEFLGLEDILLRLEQRLSLTEAEKNAAIAFEEVELKGKEHLPKLYQAIQKQQFIRLSYTPFGKPVYQRHLFPLLLKEYNNRWFLIGWENGKNDIQNLPLDRIADFHQTHETFGYNKYFEWRERFNDMIGTTLEGTLETVCLRFSESRFPYVMTKKLHHSQELAGERMISICVYINRELIARILEFGADVEVLEPKELRKKIAEILEKASTKYGEDTATIS
ncbi:MAG: WYL domain-containing protein [Spirosomataceae bacterium]